MTRPGRTSRLDSVSAFSEPVEGFDVSDLDLSTSSASGAAFGLFTPITASEYTVAVTANGEGTITLEMPGVAYAVGHNGDAAFRSDMPTYDDNEIEWDQTGPEVTVEQQAAQADPTNSEPIKFTVEFSDTVTSALGDFTPSDVELSGTAGATTVETKHPDISDLKTFEIWVTGMTGPGTVIVRREGGRRPRHSVERQSGVDLERQRSRPSTTMLRLSRLLKRSDRPIRRARRRSRSLPSSPSR